MLKKKLQDPPLDRSLIHKHSFSKKDLQDCGTGKLFGPGRAQLPINKMLMVDRILNITEDGGKYGKGKILAELDMRKPLPSSRPSPLVNPRHRHLQHFGNFLYCE